MLKLYKDFLKHGFVPVLACKYTNVVEQNEDKLAHKENKSKELL